MAIEFSLEEIELVVSGLEKDASEAFQKADIDNSNTVDIKELALLMNKSDDNPQLQFFFKAADLDHSRDLDIDEFRRLKVCFDLLSMKDITANLYAIFYFADTNCNKLLEAKEMFAMMDAFGCAGQEEYREMNEKMKAYNRQMTFTQFYECFKGKKQQ